MKTPAEARTFDDALATYQLVREILTAPPADDADERRRHRRRPLPTVHAVAPGACESVPPHEAFVPVQCHDLSERGFSFVLPERPTFHHLVAALSAPPRTYYLACEVVHCTPVQTDSAVSSEPIHAKPRRQAHDDRAGRHGSRAMYQVGCRFLRRIE